MPHLYAIYTHGNNDAKITKDIIHSRAYRMKGGVLTYKPFPFVAPKTDFWLNHFIFPDFFPANYPPYFTCCAQCHTSIEAEIYPGDIGATWSPVHKNRLTLPDFLNVENLILPKWQIFCPPSFFCHQVGHPRVEIFFCVFCCFFTTSPLVDCWKSCFTADMWEELFF